MQTNTKKFRTHSIGAILDEYEKALNELIYTLNQINNTQFLQIIEPEASHSDFFSIHNVVVHVIESGYYYAQLIQNHLQGIPTPTHHFKFTQVSQALVELKNMLNYTETILNPIATLTDEQIWEKGIITTAWKQQYDIEQLLEHAITHVLRHRRQIEKMIQTHF